MQESRLFKIIYYLLNKEKVTATELAEKLEVSVRTIYRDIDAISSAGIPIYAEAGRNGGIRFLDGFVLNQAILSEQEKHKILTALQSLSVTGYPAEDDFLQKLSALFSTQIENWLEIDFSRWGDNGHDNQKFESLKTAVIRHNTASIIYVDYNGKQTKRNVQPLKLLYKTATWYLKAYCTEKQDFRTFKLNRIININILDKKFTPLQCPPTESNATNQHYDTMILRFPKALAPRIYDEFESDQIYQQEIDYLTVSAQMPVDSWLIGYLLSFGTQVDVLEPEYLHNILADRAKELYEKYVDYTPK